MMDLCYPSCWIQTELMVSFFFNSTRVIPEDHPFLIKYRNQVEEAKKGGNHFIPGICVPEWTARRWGIYWRIASEQLNCPPTQLRLRGWTSVSAEVRHKMVLFVQFILGLEGCQIGFWVRRYGGGLTFTHNIWFVLTMRAFFTNALLIPHGVGTNVRECPFV